VLGDALRRARLAAGLTQEALAAKARLSREYLSQLENDRKSPTVAVLLRLCRAMNASASALIAAVERTPD
jgi:transcriptional regulator with XRE-family HTH domain